MNVPTMVNQLKGLAITDTSRMNRKHGVGTQKLCAHPCQIAAEYIEQITEKYEALVNAVVQTDRGETKQQAALRYIREAQQSRGVLGKQGELDIR